MTFRLNFLVPPQCSAIARHAILAMLTLLTACGQGSSASSGDAYSKALTDWYTDHPVCLTRVDKLPIDVPADAKSATLRAGMDALVAAGLMTSMPISKEAETFGHGSGKVAHLRYQPTATGAATIHPAANHFLGGTDFCFATRHIIAIKSSTVPADVMGMLVSNVTYSWKLEPDGWAGGDAVRAAFPEIKRALDNPAGEATDALVKTETGWVHERAVGTGDRSK